MSEVITMASSEIADDKEYLRKESIMHKNQLYQFTFLTMVILSRYCPDLDKRSMYHDLP